MRAATAANADCIEDLYWDSGGTASISVVYRKALNPDQKHHFADKNQTKADYFPTKYLRAGIVVEAELGFC